MSTILRRVSIPTLEAKPTPQRGETSARLALQQKQNSSNHLALGEAILNHTQIPLPPMLEAIATPNLRRVRQELVGLIATLDPDEYQDMPAKVVHHADSLLGHFNITSKS